MKIKNVTRIRLVVGVYGIDSEIVKEHWTYKELDYSEESMDDLLLAIDKLDEEEIGDTCWLEYYVPTDDEWCRREDLPAICICQ